MAKRSIGSPRLVQYYKDENSSITMVKNIRTVLFQKSFP